MPTFDAVDADDSSQNAFVQDWLTAWSERHGDDADHILAVIEMIQETYNYREDRVA